MTANKDEQEWFRKFYEGTFLVKGWKARTKEILQAVLPDRKEEIRKSLEILGEKIGREWAKDNSVRRIDTPMLRDWGERLSAGRKEGPVALEKTIQGVETEVDKVLS